MAPSPITSEPSTSMAPAVDLQIVGAGLAGLIAANAALDEGLSVRLIEKQTHVGGRAISRSKDGHVLNQGPHALYTGGALDRALQRFGLSFDGAPPQLDGARGVIDDTEGLLPGGPLSLFRSTLLTARSKLAMAGFFARLGRIDDAALGAITADRWIDGITDRDDLRKLLRGIVILTTYNSATDLMSADAVVAALRDGLGPGVRYIDGGWQTMVDALERRLGVHAGGRLDRVYGGVTEVLPAGDGGWFCRVDDRRLTGRSLLIAAGAPAVVDRLTGTTDLAAAAGPPVMASVLDLGLRSKPDTSVFMDFSTAGPVLYYSEHSVAGGMAPAGGALVSVARYQPPEDTMGPDESKAVLHRHATRAGIDARDVVMERYLHRLPVAWGTPMAANGGLSGRPDAVVGGHPGLYVAGDWVGNEGLLANASVASALRSVTHARYREGRSQVGGAGRLMVGATGR